MKIPKKSYKKYIAVAVVVAILVISGGIYAYTTLFQQTKPSHNENNHSAPSDNTSRENSTDNTADTSSNLPDKTEPSSNNEVAQPSSGGTPNGNGAEVDTPSKQIETPRIERAGQSGDNLKVVASFQKSSSGSCELRITKDDTTLTRSTSIVIGPSYYTCSFSVATSALSPGSWQVMIRHINSNSVANSDMRNVEIR